MAKARQAGRGGTKAKNTEDGLSHAQKAFLFAFIQCGTIYHASQKAGVGSNDHRVWMSSNPVYKTAFRQAEDAVVEKLERAAIKRAHDGVRRKKFYPKESDQAGEEYCEREYSDGLLMFLLKGHRPEKYRDRQDVRLSGGVKNQVDLNCTLKVDELSSSAKREVLGLLRKQRQESRNGSTEEEG